MSLDFVNQLVFFNYIETAQNSHEECNEFANLLFWILSLCLSRESLTCDARSLHLCILFKTLFTRSGGPRSSGVSVFCFVSPRAWKQKKPTPLDRGPPLNVNRPFKFLFLYLWYIPPHSCAFHIFYFFLCILPREIFFLSLMTLLLGI